MKKVWIRLGGNVYADEKTVDAIMGGDEKALVGAIKENGFELNGNSYIPSPNGDGEDVDFDIKPYPLLKGHANEKEYTKTNEVCPYCGAEVELDAELKVQTCPECGKRIVPCSVCTACESKEPYCAHCCLERKANEENTAKEKKRVFRFYWRQWADVVVDPSELRYGETAEDKANDLYNNGVYDEVPGDYENTGTKEVTDWYEENGFRF